MQCLKKQGFGKHICNIVVHASKFCRHTWNSEWVIEHGQSAVASANAEIVFEVCQDNGNLVSSFKTKDATNFKKGHKTDQRMHAKLNKGCCQFRFCFDSEKSNGQMKADKKIEQSFGIEVSTKVVLRQTTSI